MKKRERNEEAVLPRRSGSGAWDLFRCSGEGRDGSEDPCGDGMDSALEAGQGDGTESGEEDGLWRWRRQVRVAPASGLPWVGGGIHGAQPHPGLGAQRSILQGSKGALTGSRRPAGSRRGPPGHTGSRCQRGRGAAGGAAGCGGAPGPGPRRPGCPSRRPGPGAAPRRAG